MSEQPRISTPNIDSGDVNMAFDPELRQAQQDWSDYLGTRDQKDLRGNVHDAQSGQFKSVDSTPDGNRALYEGVVREAEDSKEGSRENWSFLKLAHAARAARIRGDRTVLGDIEDDIQDKLLAIRSDENSKWSEEDADFMLDKVTSIIYDDKLLTDREQPAPSGPEKAEAKPGEGRDALSQALAVLDQLKNAPSDPAVRAKFEQAHDQINQIIKDIDEVLSPKDVDAGDKTPPFSQEEIDALRAESEDADNEPAVDSTGKELERYRTPKDRKSDVMRRCDEYLKDPDNPEHVEMMKNLTDSRQEYLEVIARAEKGHSLRRIRPGGRVDSFLRRIGAQRISEMMTAPSRRESEAANKYAEAYNAMNDQMNLFFHGQQELGNITEIERQELYVESLTAQHLANAQQIAEIQKESSKKPMNKWLRRAGYVAAGVGGALITTAGGPLAWIGGISVAVGGAAGIRAAANKLNAHTVNRDTGDLHVDEKAAKFHQDFSEGLSLRVKEDQHIPGIRDVIGTHSGEVAGEIASNKERMLKPVLVALGAFALTRLGYHLMETQGQASAIKSSGNEDKLNNPSDRTGVDPEDVPTVDDTPEGEGSYQPPHDLEGDNSGETMMVPTEAYVEPGSGEIRETKQVLEQVLGREVSMEDAERVYNSVTQNQGDIFVNDQNYIGPDNDVRISAPGTYTFKEGIVDKMVEQYNSLNA